MASVFCFPSPMDFTHRGLRLCRAWQIHWIWLLACICLLGCATRGIWVSPEAESGITTGKSTKDEVIRLLGVPSSSETANGKAVLVYSFHQPGLSNLMATFSVLCDEAGRVIKTHRYHCSSQSQTNWVNTKVALDRIVATVVRGQTRFDDLVRKLNPPRSEVLNFDGRIHSTWLVWDRSYSFTTEMICWFSVLRDEEGFIQDYRVLEQPTR